SVGLSNRFDKALTLCRRAWSHAHRLKLAVGEGSPQPLRRAEPEASHPPGAQQNLKQKHDHADGNTEKRPDLTEKPQSIGKEIEDKHLQNIVAQCHSSDRSKRRERRS